ncbi:MAG: cysteine--tRNA ligase [Verrucomicrobiales bacterium]|jgi:cysteinyl-tRNA synthetase|nr:cysteine--tRNA ligase [Verrucomicrobiales bacterium]
MPQHVQLYDTMTRSVRNVSAADGVTVRFYCCGPTVYGPAHIGNFRTFVSQDVLRRVLELAGWRTKHVRNLTDVDDKTIRQSQAVGEPLTVFTDRWRELFRADGAALNLLPPHVEPGAVAHIPQQIALVEKLLAKNHAYRTDDGSVWFRLASFPDYGKLSRVQERELAAGASGAATVSGRNLADEYERESLADFALWKARKPADGDNFWRAPWGEGRPGWHLECSCMSMRYLGESFDLHGGGVDLIFPHHENEIAQSEAATGRPFAAHWFHTNHLLVANRKMSKSEGNLYTLADLQRRGFTPMETRYVLLAGKYSQPLNFTLESLAAARVALKKLARAAVALSAGAPALDYEQLVNRAAALSADNPFHPAWAALKNDLNVSAALGHTFVALKDAGRFADPPAAWLGFQRVIGALGLTLPPADDDPVPAAVPAAARDLVAQRWAAKKAQHWQLADQYRARLAALGWTMQDAKDSYKLVRAGDIKDLSKNKD